jgi:hypothetical protein
MTEHRDAIAAEPEKGAGGDRIVKRAAAAPPSFPHRSASPRFSMPNILDMQKQPPYSSTSRKQCLIQPKICINPFDHFFSRSILSVFTP